MMKCTSNSRQLMWAGILGYRAELTTTSIFAGLRICHHASDSLLYTQDDLSMTLIGQR